MTNTEIESAFFKERIDAIVAALGQIVVESGHGVLGLCNNKWRDSYPSLHGMRRVGNEVATALIKTRMVEWLYERGVSIYREFGKGFEGGYRVMYAGPSGAESFASKLNNLESYYKTHHEALYAAVLAMKGT